MRRAAFAVHEFVSHGGLAGFFGGEDDFVAGATEREVDGVEGGFNAGELEGEEGEAVSGGVGGLRGGGWDRRREREVLLPGSTPGGRRATVIEKQVA